MDALAYDLKNICQHNRDGSHATQAARHRGLQLISRELKEMGFKLPSAKSFKPKHFDKLIARWINEKKSAGTIKNRLSDVRWLLGKIGKSSILPKDNAALGIEARTSSKADKSQKLDMDKLQNIPCPKMQMSMRLMSAFGLRMEEALKFQPDFADRGDKLALKASWTKGGRARTIPIHSERHRQLLNEARKLAGNGSLIPAAKSYIQHRKAFEYQTLKNGFSNLHGLRHGYAQWRYGQLTGFKCPATKDGLQRSKMTPEQKALDAKALQIISREMGHERPSITKVYVG